jgi:hypothetical protein
LREESFQSVKQQGFKTIEKDAEERMIDTGTETTPKDLNQEDSVTSKNNVGK